LIQFGGEAPVRCRVLRCVVRLRSALRRRTLVKAAKAWRVHERTGGAGD
jgi:hypothetical protein